MSYMYINDEDMAIESPETCPERPDTSRFGSEAMWPRGRLEPPGAPGRAARDLPERGGGTSGGARGRPLPGLGPDGSGPRQRCTTSDLCKGQRHAAVDAWAARLASDRPSTSLDASEASTLLALGTPAASRQAWGERRAGPRPAETPTGSESVLGPGPRRGRKRPFAESGVSLQESLDLYTSDEEGDAAESRRVVTGDGEASADTGGATLGGLGLALAGAPGAPGSEARWVPFGRDELLGGAARRVGRGGGGGGVPAPPSGAPPPPPGRRAPLASFPLPSATPAVRPPSPEGHDRFWASFAQAPAPADRLSSPNACAPSSFASSRAVLARPLPSLAVPLARWVARRRSQPVPCPPLPFWREDEPGTLRRALAEALAGGGEVDRPRGPRDPEE